MLDVERRILDIDKTLCENIDLMDFQNVTRALVSQNLLSQSRNLIEHIAVRAYSEGKDVQVKWDTINAGLDYIKHNGKYLFLRKFHNFLQESKSHYTPDAEGAERLMLKYYQYFVMIRGFVKDEYGLEILHNLEKFPTDQDETIELFHEKIVEKLKMRRQHVEYDRTERLYVHKVAPFVVGGRTYFEMVLTPAYDTTSKFERFIAYATYMIPSHYSIKAAIFSDTIEIDGNVMPISIMTEYTVSVRPCELNNFAKIFGYKIKMDANHAEYIGMMNYLTNSGASLLDVVMLSDDEYANVKQKMFAKAQVHNFEPVLDECREFIKDSRSGSNVIRYLLHTLNNKVIKAQYAPENNSVLSDLRLEYGCIPFDQMPFASSLIQHNPSISELYGCINSDNREHEMIAGFILENMSTNGVLYTTDKELKKFASDAEQLIDKFNAKVYYKHRARRNIARFGDNYYIKGALTDTKTIIEALQEKSIEGLQGYENAMCSWIEEKGNIDSEEKKNILVKLYANSNVALIYGAAGTGKTYLINLLSQFMDSQSKLYLANTYPAVENLRRKVKAQNCDFMTVKKYAMSSSVSKKYDVLIVDECSMVSNEDMVAVFNKIDCRLMLLVGDTYQIESITFGNWFSMAKYFIPQYTWYELTMSYRTNDPMLLDLWTKVRNIDEDLTEYIVHNRYSSNLDSSVYKKQAEDEIILCLNYDGLYGINNINRFLQENNKSEPHIWGLWTYKVGDPILFNESDRFAPLLYNNLKGTIVDIEEDLENEKIWFSIEIDKPLTELDVQYYDIELLKDRTPGKSVIRFYARKKKESDDDRSIADDTVIPFQIAYAVSIHKAQGLEYDSVKVIITREVDERITHNIFYTAITRSKRLLKIYWSPETQEKVINSFELSDNKRDATIFAAQTGLKMVKMRERRNKEQVNR